MARSEVVRLNINLPVPLMERLDEYADKMNINRTSAVAVLLSQALDSQKAISDISDLSGLVNPAAEPSFLYRLLKSYLVSVAEL